MESADVSDFLTHHGIKGMRWGRRSKSSPVTTTSDYTNTEPGHASVTVTSVPGKGIKKTEGGKEHPVHDDAARAAATRQLAKSSTTDAVGSKDLQAALSRMKLEDSYKAAIATRNSKGPKAFLIKFLLAEGKAKATGNETPTAKAVKQALALSAKGTGKHRKGTP